MMSLHLFFRAQSSNVFIQAIYMIDRFFFELYLMTRKYLKLIAYAI